MLNSAHSNFICKISKCNLVLFICCFHFLVIPPVQLCAQQSACNIVLTPNPSNATCGLSNGGMGFSIQCNCKIDSTFILKLSNGITSTSCSWPDITGGKCSGISNNVAIGSYTLTATSGIGTGVGCSVTRSVTIGNTVSGGTTPVTILSEVGCGVGASNGSVQVNLTGTTPGIPTYSWSNGATSKTVTGLSPGTYTVTIDVGGGCTRTGTVVLQSCAPTPIANFSANVACFGIPSQFTDLSIGADDWLWSFGDGTISTIQNPTHLFSSPGSKTVKLVVKGKCGCSDSITKVISVNPSPGPKIVCPSTVCPNANSPYTTTSVCSAYNWSVVGGTIISGQNTPQILVNWGAGPVGTITLGTSGCTPANCSTPSTVSIPILPPAPVITGPAVVCINTNRNYSLPAIPGGIYNWSIVPAAAGTINSGQGTSEVIVRWNSTGNPNAQLIATIGNSFVGCSSTATLPIKIQTIFSLSGTTQLCGGTSSTITASPATNFNWTVSGGTIASGQGSATVSINWPTVPGIYSVTATDASGSYCNGTATRTVTVVNVPPVDSITGQKSNVCPGSAYIYNAWSASGGPYTWTAVNGTVSSANANPVNVTWGASGPYSLTATQTISGCTSSPVTINVTTLQVAPPSIVGLQSVCNNGTYNYQLPALNGATYSWTINPASAGSVISGQGSRSVTIQYSSPGTITITAAISLCPSSVSSSLSVVVLPAPSPTINVTGILCPGASATLTSGGVFPAYEWKNESLTVIGSNSSVNISAAGSYMLIVTDNNGCKGTTTAKIEAAPKPDANISTPDKKNFCSTEAINSTLYAMVSAGYTFQWYRNGIAVGTSSSLNVTTTGSYYVVVTNAQGCTQSASTINITQSSCGGGGGACPNPPCPFVGTTEPVDFGGNSTNWFIPSGGSSKDPNEGVSVLATKVFCTNVINFTDNSVNTNSTQWFWDFGDGSGTSSLRNPTYTYARAGFYRITFNVRFSNGNVGYIQKSIEIPIVPDFSAIVKCGTATFTDLSTHTPTSSITSWNWNFGDATTSTLQNPIHAYASPGTYNVTLTISGGGCTLTYNKSIIVPPPIVAQFTALSSCAGSPVSFTDASTGANITFWSWSFGNGSVSAVQNPLFTYPNSGTYSVTLKVTDINGCTGTRIQSVTIAPTVGGAAITASGTTKLCVGQTVSLTAPPATTYLWSNGATAQTIIVNQSGIYSVIPFGAGSCKTLPAPITVTVWPLPNVTISSPVSEFCTGQTFTITVPYKSGYMYQWYDGAGSLVGKTSFSLNSSSAGTYSVIVTDAASGCSATSSPITVNALPSPSIPVITGVPSFCQRSSAVLNASSSGGTGALVYSWLTGQTTTSITVTKAGVYQIIVTDQKGCTRSAGRNMIVNPLPDLSVFPVGCYTKCGTDSIFGPGGYPTYQWQLNGANISTSRNIKSTVSGVYRLIVSTTLGCIDTTGDLSLTIVPKPKAYAGPDVILCGGSTQLNGSGGSVYSWSPPSFLSSTIIPNPIATATSTINYQLLVIDNNGCSDIDSVKITVSPAISLTISQTNIICSGASAGSASASPINGTAPFVYSWNSSQTTQTISNLSVGIYSVTITDSKGCTTTSSVSISSPSPLIAQFAKGTANCTGCSCKEWIHVNASGGTSPYSYVWPDAYVNRYKNQLCPGVYIVNVKDKNGCSVNVSINAP